MDFEGLLSNPYVSVVVSVATGVLGNFVWSNINKKKTRAVINKSLTSTINCIESYKEYSEVIKEVLLENFERIITENKDGGRLEEILLAEFRLILRNFDLLNLQYQEEFIRLFFLFFLAEIVKDDELWNNMEYTYLNSIYQEIIDTKQFMEVQAKNFQDCFKETQNIINIYMTGAIDCSSYKNKIHGRIKELQLLKCDESIFFVDIFNYLKKKIMLSWKERCQVLIDKIYNSEVDSYKKLKIQELNQCFKDSTSCELVNEKLKNIEPYLKKSDRNNVVEMQKLSYDRCFIVSGEPGTGKTEFIKEIMMYYSKTDEIYLVPLDQQTLNRCGNLIDLENELVKNINFYLGTKFMKLSDVITYCDNIANIRIVILIDNLHIVALEKKRMVNLLVRTMENNSGINILFWIFTVDQYSMHIFDEINTVDFRRYAISDRDFIHGLKSSIYNYDFNLTRYNYYKKTGANILTSYGCQNVNILMNNSNTITIKTVDNPLFAHFIGMKKGDIGSLQLESFYIDFAISIIDYLHSSLDGVFDNNPEIRKNIINGTKLIGKHVIDSSTINFSQGELSQIIDNNTEKALRQVDLIIRVGTKKNENLFTENYGEKEELLQLNFKLFWAHKVFIASGIANNMNFSEEFYNLFSKLMQIEKYCEEICGYVTYKLEEQKNNEFWQQWLTTLSNEKMLYVLFIYLDRLKLDSVNIVFFILNMHKMKLTNKDIFTLVYALGNVTASVEDKYKLIAMYLGDIENASKQHYNFNSVFTAITEQNTSCDELLKNIIYLINNEAVKLNVFIGSCCAEKFCQLSDFNFLESVKIIDKFIIENEEKLKKVNINKKSRAKFEKQYFFDEFIKQYFYIQILVNGLNEVYNELIKHDFFKGTKSWRNKLFRYNFSRAAGDNFSQYQLHFITTKEQSFRKDYIELVSRLVRSGNISEIIFGFHFITNSLKNDRDNSEKLDPALQDLLLEIYKMDELDDFKKKRKIFFDRVSSK